jgi:hemerythrin
MPYFTWQSSYSVGNKELDAQHQKLIEMINHLHDAMKAGRGSTELSAIFIDMANYTQSHFSAEERILSANTYPSLGKQKIEHNAFTKKLLEYQEQYRQGKMAMSIEVLNFLKDWLTNHILVEDMKYSSFLAQKGVV